MRCSNCGSENPEGIKFCGQCGTPLKLRCPKCGFENPLGFKFCGECGTLLSAPAPALEPRREPLAVSSEAEPERRQLTVMFCDLVGSTPLSEQLDPEDLREVIRAYQEVCERTIGRYDGRIARYVGDGLLVYFGYPQAHEDDAQRAVRAGLGIIEGIGSLNPRLQAERGIQLAVRLGIHTGLVIVGEMGGETHDTMDIVGENANIAARVQASAKPNAVVITSATHRLIKGFFEAKPLGTPPLNGISRPLELFQILHESAARSRLDVEASAGLIPLVGRKQELALLLEVWERDKDGEGQVVLLSGEAGIGKSRLVEALKEQVAIDPRAWLTPCQCSPFYQNSSLYPIIDLLRRVVLQFDQEDSVEQKLGKLEGFLVQYGLSLPEMTPLFAALLSLQLDGRYPLLNLSPEQQKQKTLQALLTVLLERAARQPLLFVVEDLHWMDPTTLEFLNLLVDQGPTTRILAVFTYRPDFAPPWTGRSHVLQLTLNRLTRQQVESMIHEVTRGKTLPAEVLEQIVNRTDGVPLFVEELTKMVLESGLLKERGENYELAAPLPPLAIPSTLRDSLMARLDRLVTVKEVAQLGATLGREFSYQLLLAIAPVDEVTLQSELGRLVGAELLYQRGVLPQASYIFKHAMVQEAAYESQLKRKRQQVHERIANVLAERFPEIAETQPELLAYHFTEAGLKEQAITYWLRAGRRAAERSANVEAIAHLTQGLALLKTLPATSERDRKELDFQLALGPVLYPTKGYAAPEVGEAFQRAQELAVQVGDQANLFTALRVGWAFYVVAGEVTRSEEVAEQLVNMARGEDDSAQLVDALRMLGASKFWHGKLKSAREQLQVVIDLYNPTKHATNALLYGQDPAIVGRGYAAVTLWCLGYPDQGARRAREALDPAMAPDHPFSRLFAHILICWLHQFLYNTERTKKHAEEAIAIGADLRAAFWLAGGTLMRGWVLAAQGELNEGIRQIQIGLSQHRATGAVLITPYYLSLLASAYEKAGQLEQAIGALDQALTIAQQTGESWCEAELHRLRGNLTLSRTIANKTQAEVSFRQAIEIAQQQAAKSWELRATISLAQLLNKQGRREEARQRLQEIYGWFTEGFETADLREAKALLDELS